MVVPQSLSVKVTPGKAKAENRTRAAEEEKAEEKRLAIMMMKKKEKYLYDKIMFGKKRKVREVRRIRNRCISCVIHITFYKKILVVWNIEVFFIMIVKQHFEFMLVTRQI